MSRQVKTEVEVTYKKRNRKTVFWRGILVFPMAVFISSFAVNSNSGWASGFLILPAFLAIVFREVYPSYLLTFNHALLELQTRVVAYALLLTDDYPSIERNKDIAVIFPDIKGGKTLNRWLPLVKWFLAIPLIIVGLIYSIIALGMTFIAWIMTSVTGNYPKWAGKFVLKTMRFWNRVNGYAFLLVSDKYPSFAL
jgi:TRAP-type mannitol/chloroaromatic compound transport system permease small subunit